MNKINLHGKLATTVVGSFPLTDSEENMEKAINDQINANIDYVTYGQLKDMNKMFLDPLTSKKVGFGKINEEYWIVDEISDLKDPITLEYLDFLKNHVKKTNQKIKGYKIQITGAITLAGVLKIAKENFAIEYDDFLLNIADVIKKIAQFYDKAGAHLITIDEPSLSYAMWLGKESDVLIECINKQVSAIKKACKGIHACGEITGFTDILLKSDVDYLDHEFIAHPSNIGEYKKSELEKYDKMIGLGSVRTSLPPLDLVSIKEGKKPIDVVIESKNDIKKHILNAGGRVGLENLIIDPDCGFGGIKQYLEEKTAQEIAFLKMKNMCDAVSEIKKENKLE